jgi:GWxTD domain-containing protein
MCCSRTLKVLLVVLFSLFLSGSLWARKPIEMPANFGTDEWAIANYQDAVNYLHYLSERKTRQALVSVPDNLRLEAWQQFWKKLDPVSKTPENEYQIEYFARIRYANEHYTTNLQPGWLTDRGEAYVRLGAPKDIEKFTMRARGRDIEVWEYWAPREVQLFFYDRTGVGDFFLLNPADMMEEVFIGR